MGPLRLAELQQRINQMNRPQWEGTFQTPGGGVSGITFDPNTGQPSTTELTRGIDSGYIRNSILAMKAAAGKPYQGQFDQYLRDIDAGIDPLLVNNQAQTYNASISRTGQKGWQIKTDAGGLPAEVIGPDGESYSPYAPDLPPEAAAIVKQYRADYTQRQKDLQDAAEASSARTLQRMQTMEDVREGERLTKQKHTDALNAQKAASDALKYTMSKVQAYQQYRGQHYVQSVFGGGSDLKKDVESAVQDYENKRQDAIDKLTAAGMPIPFALRNAIPPAIAGIPNTGGVQPPSGFKLDNPPGLNP